MDLTVAKLRVTHVCDFGILHEERMVVALREHEREQLRQSLQLLLLLLPLTSCHVRQLCPFVPLRLLKLQATQPLRCSLPQIPV